MRYRSPPEMLHTRANSGADLAPHAATGMMHAATEMMHNGRSLTSRTGCRTPFRDAPQQQTADNRSTDQQRTATAKRPRRSPRAFGRPPATCCLTLLNIKNLYFCPATSMKSFAKRANSCKISERYSVGGGIGSVRYQVSETGQCAIACTYWRDNWKPSRTTSAP